MKRDRIDHFESFQVMRVALVCAEDTMCAARKATVVMTARIHTNAKGVILAHLTPL